MARTPKQLTAKKKTAKKQETEERKEDEERRRRSRGSDDDESVSGIDNDDDDDTDVGAQKDNVDDDDSIEIVKETQPLDVEDKDDDNEDIYGPPSDDVDANATTSRQNEEKNQDPNRSSDSNKERSQDLHRSSGNGNKDDEDSTNPKSRQRTSPTDQESNPHQNDNDSDSSAQRTSASSSRNSRKHSKNSRDDFSPTKMSDADLHRLVSSKSFGNKSTLARRDFDKLYPLLKDLTNKSKALICRERSQRQREEIVASLILQKERKDLLDYKQHIKSTVYTHYDPDMSASDTDFEEGDDLIVPGLQRCPRSKFLRHRYKTSAAKKQKYVIARRDRQSKEVSKSTYMGINHHIFFQEFETVVSVYGEEKYFMVRAKDKKEYSILTMANKLEAQDVTAKIEEVATRGSIREKSAHRNYFLGIYNCLENKIRSKIFQNRGYIQNNAIRLIWWLYSNFRKIKDSSHQDVINKIDEINFKNDPHKNIIKFFMHIRGLRDLCTNFEVPHAQLETRVVKELSCCDESIDFNTLLTIQRKKLHDKEIDFDIFLDTLQNCYTDLVRNSRWRWAKIPSKRKRGADDDDDDDLLGMMTEKEKDTTPSAKSSKPKQASNVDMSAFKAELASQRNQLKQSRAVLDAYKARFGKLKNNKGDDNSPSRHKDKKAKKSSGPEDWDQFIAGNDPTYGKSESGYKFGNKNLYWCKKCNKYTSHNTKKHKDSSKQKQSFLAIADPLSDSDSNSDDDNDSVMKSSVEE